MIHKTLKGTKYFSFNNLSKYPGLINFVSTRESGDMAYKESNPGEYIVNRRNFLGLFGVELENTVFCEQVHKDKVEFVENGFFKDRREGLNVVSQSDGLITAIPEICLVIRSADCVPIIMYDPVKNILGVAHAGWRGTLVEIVKRTVNKMQNVFGVEPGDIIVGIGPSIGPNDYLVMKDVYDKFVKADYGKFVKHVSKDQWLLDLWGLNKKQLTDSGVLSKNIEISGISTYTSDKLFSYRKNDPMGHFITGAMLK